MEYNYNYCKICTEVIYNKYTHAKYCKECVEQIRDKKLHQFKVEKAFKQLLSKEQKKQSLPIEIFVQGENGRPALRPELIREIQELRKKIKVRSIIKLLALKYNYVLAKSTINKHLHKSTEDKIENVWDYVDKLPLTITDK